MKSVQIRSFFLVRIQAEYKKIRNRKHSAFEHFSHSALLVQKQQDGHNHSLFAVAFDAEILDGKSLLDAVFHFLQLRIHPIYCLESGALTPFPKI